MGGNGESKADADFKGDSNRPSDVGISLWMSPERKAKWKNRVEKYGQTDPDRLWKTLAKTYDDLLLLNLYFLRGKIKSNPFSSASSSLLSQNDDVRKKWKQLVKHGFFILHGQEGQCQPKRNKKQKKEQLGYVTGFIPKDDRGIGAEMVKQILQAEDSPTAQFYCQILDNATGEIEPYESPAKNVTRKYEPVSGFTNLKVIKPKRTPLVMLDSNQQQQAVLNATYQIYVFLKEWCKPILAGLMRMWIQKATLIVQSRDYVWKPILKYSELLFPSPLIPSAFPQYVQGAATLTEVVVPVNDGKDGTRRIHMYLFGDYHNYNKKEQICGTVADPSVLISDFIRDTIKNHPDKTIDLFLETPHKRHLTIRRLDSTITSDQGYLFGETVALFRPCVKGELSECHRLFPNVRVHNIDSRAHLVPNEFYHTYENLSTITHNLSDVLDDYSSHPDFFSSWLQEGGLLASWWKDWWPNLLETIENWYSRFYRQGINHSDIRQTIRKLKIEKQIDAIADSKLKQAVWKWMDKRLKQEIPELEAFVRRIPEWRSRPVTKKDVRIWKSLERAMTSYETLWQDVYMVARILRVYKTSTLPGAQNDPVQYVMAYLGDYHVQVLKNFFDTLEGAGSYRLTETETRCLDLRDFQRPFFSTYIPEVDERGVAQKVANKVRKRWNVDLLGSTIDLKAFWSDERLRPAKRFAHMIAREISNHPQPSDDAIEP